MDKLEEEERRRRRADLQRVLDLDEAIDTAVSFLRLADMELDRRRFEQAEDLVVKVRLTNQTATKIVPLVEDTEQRLRLRDRLQTLADAISDLERKRRREA
jgi:hypothetical protein